MGISLINAKMLLNIHKASPLQNMVTLGRQTMQFSLEQAKTLLGSLNIPYVPEVLERAQRDEDTLEAKVSDSEFISDRDFFNALGVDELRSIDCSDYEHADIIHDLNFPMKSNLFSRLLGKENLVERFDFILDGSTLDNVFSPSEVMRNMARMLKKGGRLYSINMASNHHVPYTLATPLWFFDYFVVNKFQDCKVYISVYHPTGAHNVFWLDIDAIRKEEPDYVNFTCEGPYLMHMLAYAEKGPDSTWDVYPTQRHYRSESEWRFYERQLECIRSTSDASYEF